MSAFGALPVALAPSGVLADARAVDRTCLHCGTVVGAAALMVRIDGAEAPVCCEGCASAALWIRDAGLADWFRLRQAQGPKGRVASVDYRGWAHPDVLAAHAQSVPGGCALTVLTDGMRCAACAWLLDRALAGQAGVLEVSANAVSGRVRLVWDPAQVALPDLLARMDQLGYPPQLATGLAAEQARLKRRRGGLLKLTLAALGALQAMMFAEAAWLDGSGQMPIATRDFLRWITLLVSTPVVLWAGAGFFTGMLREFRARSAGMDTLVSVSLALAWSASVIETLRGGPEVWFDAAVMFVFLLLLARQLEALARQRASAQIDLLARAQPVLARRERADGVVEQVPAAQLQRGDPVQVAAGEALPADGVLLDAQARLDESLLTGEALPVVRQAGQRVLAGSVARGQPLRFEVTASAGATQVAQLLRLVERAQAQRPQAARLADRIAAWCVPAMLLLALAVALGWTLVEPARALPATLAVLAVTCPCALSLAVPAALTVALGALARGGVLAVDGDAVLRLAHCDRLLCDKTGTLTRGQPTLAQTELGPATDRAGALAIAAALQRGSGHPLAAAFAPHATATVQATAVRVEPGAGVSGQVGGREYRLGRADFCGVGAATDPGIWLVEAVVPPQILLRAQVDDPVRPAARPLLDALRSLGLEAELSSGDSPAAVARLAAALEVSAWRARQSPQDKLTRLRELQQQGHRVLMLGDGSNDAPVLAGADVAVALGEGTAMARQAAALVIPGGAIERLPAAIVLARRTQRILRQNLGWALAYNVLAIPPAALGWISPWLAALGMALSSLLVTLNALRLGRRAGPEPVPGTPHVRPWRRTHLVVETLPPGERP